MKPLTCAATRRRLQAFHDRELSVTDQIAVGSHLEWCDHCAALLADLREMRSVLQAFAPGRAALSQEEAGAFQVAVVNRARAEHEASLLVRVRGMFDDMHLVYAGLGAAAATIVCIVIMLSMMRFATNERPDSLAAIVTVLATPLECESGNDLSDASGCRARWEARFQRANESAEQDVVFALDAVVTQKGRLANLEMLRARRHRATSADQVEMIEGLLDAVSRSRFDGQTPRRPVTANVLWLFDRATVRASKPPAADLPLPPKKKRAETATAVTVRA
jgi:hypothetical protein